jgi:hypothetical protein
MSPGSGLVSNGDALPRPSTVIRFAGFNRMGKDADDQIVGPLPSLFERRPDEDYLSVTWCEYYAGSPESRLRCAVEAIRNSRTVGSKACFCIAATDELLGEISKYRPEGRAVYLPEMDNPAHAGIYGVSPEDAVLLETLATTVWAPFLTKEMADNLPLETCEKSSHVA